VLLVYALGMSIGQVLFKLAADHAKRDAQGALIDRLLLNRHFALAVMVYGAMTILWVWILMRVPLSRAYPFVALAFVLTPAFAFFIFKEPLNVWYFFGSALILLGLLVLVVKAA
jgi:drug/metabolite transporter (DMT)-like permease